MKLSSPLTVFTRGRRLLLFAGIILPVAASTGPLTDADALALARKHCVMCHAVKPTHPAFAEAPNHVTLETLADLKKHAKAIYVQTVQNKAMPLGNQTGMTDDERAKLIQYASGVK